MKHLQCGPLRAAGPTGVYRQSSHSLAAGHAGPALQDILSSHTLEGRTTLSALSSRQSSCGVIARRPAGPTWQSASPAKRPAEDVGPYLALPLGELSPKVTERACRGVGSALPVGPALPGRVKPGPYKAPLIPDYQKRLAEFAARRPRIVFNPFLGAACTSRKILCAERVCFRAFLRENARVGAKSLLSKKGSALF